MERLKYLLLGALVLLISGCGQSVTKTLQIPHAAGPDAPGQGRSIVILPFADYSNASNIAAAHRRNMKVTEVLTDRLAQNGFSLPIQEDVFQYMIDKNFVQLSTYEDNQSTSLKNELTNDWSNEMMDTLRFYISQTEVEKDSNIGSIPGTRGLSQKTVAKMGRDFGADYIVRGRIIEYKTRQEVTWAPWKKGILPFIAQGTAKIFYGFAGSDKYDEYNTMAAGGMWGAIIGDGASWPYDNNEVLQGTSATYNSILWGAVGMGLGKMAHNSGKVDQAVVQLRVWVQEATTGEVVWTNRIRVQVSPESIFADAQYDDLFNSAIDKGVSTLIDNFVTTAL